jgi:hypothetical protein
MCEDCATFAFFCGSIVCLDCEKHECVEERCDLKLLVNLKVKDLLEFFCGEKVSYDSLEWERMGDEYDPTKIRDLSVEYPFTNLYSFPQILDVRVYCVDNYSQTAHQIWRRIRLANSPAQTPEAYLDRLYKMSDYEFVCWYKYRVESPYSTFEDRSCIKSPAWLESLQNSYYEGRSSAEVLRIRSALKLKNIS